MEIEKDNTIPFLDTTVTGDFSLPLSAESPPTRQPSGHEKVHDNKVMVSFDVESLLTKITIEDVVQAMEIEKDNTIPFLDTTVTRDFSLPLLTTTDIKKTMNSKLGTLGVSQ